MSTGHSCIGPSSAGRWGFCPGSVVMEARYPDDSGEAADAGEASHWVGAELLYGRVHLVGEKAPNGVVLDDEMVYGATEYARAVQHAVTIEQPYCFAIEQPLTVPAIHPQCWGTPDLWYYLWKRRELHVWDYKFGWVIVDVNGNLQLTCYAVGALAALGIFADDTDDITIVFHIVQPRPYHALGIHREWCTTWSELRPAVEQLQQAALNALSDAPIVTSGPHCRYCRARHACLASRLALYASLDYTERAVPQELDPEALGVELRIAERAEQAIKYHLAGLQAQATTLIEKGTPVSGWMVQRGQGRTKWKVPAQHVFAVGDLLGVNLRAPEAAITPAQAKTAGIPAEVVNQFAETPVGKAELVQSSRSVLAQVFGPEAAKRARNS